MCAMPTGPSPIWHVRYTKESISNISIRFRRSVSLMSAPRGPPSAKSYEKKNIRTCTTRMRIPAGCMSVPCCAHTHIRACMRTRTHLCDLLHVCCGALALSANLHRHHSRMSALNDLKLASDSVGLQGLIMILFAHSSAFCTRLRTCSSYRFAA